MFLIIWGRLKIALISLQAWVKEQLRLKIKKKVINNKLHWKMMPYFYQKRKAAHEELSKNIIRL